MKIVFLLGFTVCLSVLAVSDIPEYYALADNDPPIAANDTSTTFQGTADTIDVLANDVDPEGGILNTRYAAFLGPRNGTARVLNENEIIYTPNLGYVGLDSFQYFSCDASSECSAAWIFITVEDVPEPPMIDESVLSAVETDEDTALDILIGANAIDPEGDVLVISILDDVLHGTTTLIGDIINYIPAENYNGIDSLRFIVCDPTPLCDTLWTIITIHPINDDPVTTSDQITLTEDTLNAVILPLINDSDVDGDRLTIGSLISISTTASLTIIDDTTIIYTPPADYFGVDTLIYEACDLEVCIVDTLIITVTPINDAPSADDDSATTDEENPILIPFLDNDMDIDSDNLISTITTSATNGTVRIFNDSLHYIPNLNFNGIDSVQYVLCDAEPLCDTAWIRITVNPINDDPVTTGDQITLTEDTINVVILPLINDSDSDGDRLTIGSIISISTTATLAITDDTTITYTPPADYFGVDTLIYEACDLQICIVDTIIITITPINDAPIAEDDLASTDEDNSIRIPFSDNDIDIDSDNLTLTISASAANGTASIINGALQYNPNPGFNGLDSVQYVLCDEEPLCDTAWIRITINPINDDPETVSDQITLTEDTINAVILPLINDSDSDGDRLTIGSIISISTTAIIAISDDTTITYTPPADYFGIDTLIYEACDLQICIVDTIVVTITPVNDSPIAEDDLAATDEDIPILIPFSDNDRDIDSDNLTMTINTGPVNGTVRIFENSFYYIPNLDFYGLDSIQYVLCDVEPLCDTAWVLIIVNPVNDGPETASDQVTLTEDTINAVILPLINDNDEDGDRLTIGSIISISTTATIAISDDTTITYTPPTDFFGVDTLIYEACDLQICIVDTIFITVTPINDAPIAQDDLATTNEDNLILIPLLDNDMDIDGDNLTITINTSAVNGSASIINGSLEYNPNPDFYGLDSVQYFICDAEPLCDTATVFITIEFRNEKPIAENDYLTIVDTACINLNIMVNDIDPNGDTLIIEILNGRSPDVTIENNGTITYCPPNNFMVSDTIYYAVCDTQAMQLCDTAMIVIEMICPSFNHALAHDALCPDVTFSVTGTDEMDLTEYEWSFTDQLGIITTEPTIAELNISNPKRLALKSQRYGCLPQYDSINIFVRNAVLPAVLDREQIECENTSVSLSINAPDNQLNYDWYYASTNTLVGTGEAINIPDLNNTTAGDYYVIASDGFCTSNRSENLTLAILTDLAPPAIEAGEDQLICGQEITLNALASTGMPTWSTNGSTFIADANNTTTRIFDPEIGENKFYWIQENLSCQEPSIDSVSVFYYPLPAPIRDSFFVEINEDYFFDLKPNDNYYNINASISVLNTPEEVTDHGDGTITVNIDGSKESPLDFEYEVCFDACPDNCQTTVVNVHFEQPSICVVPNVITPNGDGINDYLVIDCTYQYPQSSMIIFNRWGDEVYNNKDYDNTWNGMKDGKPLAAGTYFYLFKVNDTEETVDKGFIHVDR